MNSRLPERLLALLTPQAYPHATGVIQVVETHISWVLLAGEFAYKIKRPVQYPFVDLRTLERRRFLCEEELRLNRRFAPELYLEVCRIVDAGGLARIGSEGPALEYAVRMRRFDRGAELDRLLEELKVDPFDLEAFGSHLATVHATLPAATTESPWGRPADVHSLMIRNLVECSLAARAFGTSGTVLELRRLLEARLEPAAAVMAERRAGGRVRECHGDLHSRNIVRLGDRLVPFDCLEYEPAFRWIDVADEIAALASDLDSRARPLHALAFVSGYLARCGDYHACRVLKLYEAHRSLVRAKVAALTAEEMAEDAERSTLRREHARSLDHASAALGPYCRVLLLMCGVSGSGKTWIARQLAGRLLAIHVRSDVERKRRAGLDALARSHSGLVEGLYSIQTSALVYESLARTAEDILCGGFTAIIDGTFLTRERRGRFAELGARLGVRVHLVYCTAPVPVLRARIAARDRGSRDPSEADASVLQWQLSHLEAPSPDEPIDTLCVETADPDALEKVLRVVGASSRARTDGPAA